MRTLTTLILLPLVVLAPLLMAPAAYAIEVEPRPTVFVTVQSSELLAVDNPGIGAILAALAIGLPGGLSGSGESSFFPEPEGHTRGTAGVGVDGLSDGNIVWFKGAVTRSTDPELLKTPVAITANATDGLIVFVFGPISAGKLAGQTFTFKGVGTVIIVCLDCRSD